MKTQPTLDNFNDNQVNQLTRDELEKIQNTWDLPKSLKNSKDFSSEDLNADSKNSGTLHGNQTVGTVLSTEKNDKNNNDSLLGKRKLFQVETVKNECSQDKQTKSEDGLVDGGGEPEPLKIRKTSDNGTRSSEENLFKKSTETSQDHEACPTEENQSKILALLKEIKDNQIKFQRENQMLRSFSLLASKQWQREPRIIQKNQETYNIYGNADGPPMTFKMPTGTGGISLGARLEKARAKQAQNQVRIANALELAKQRQAFLRQSDASATALGQSIGRNVGGDFVPMEGHQFQRITDSQQAAEYHQQSRIYPREEVIKSLGRMPTDCAPIRQAPSFPQTNGPISQALLIGRAKTLDNTVQALKEQQVRTSDLVSEKRDGKSIPEQLIRGSLNPSQLGQVNATAVPAQLFRAPSQPVTNAQVNWQNQSGVSDLLQMLKKK